MATKKEQFIAQIAPLAQEVQRKYGVPASIVIAQAALESGWGEKAKGNNYFGIKADKTWNGESISALTHEYVKGVRASVTDGFRVYKNLADSVENYGKFLSSNRRYTDVITAKTGHEAADALQEAGYATDPKYAKLLKDIIRTNKLTRFDDQKFKDYIDNGHFQENNERLWRQKKENPDVWNHFMEGLAKVIMGLYDAIASIFSDKESPQVDQNSIKIQNLPLLSNKALTRSLS